MMNADTLHHILNPRSVALIGASNKRGKIGNQVLQNLLGQGFEGKVYPINPKETEIGGWTAYAKITDVGDDIDVAAVAVPVRAVAGAVAECAEQGVKGVVIYAGGFAEKDEEGAGLQAQLADIHRRTGIRIFGPNINGIYNAAAKMNLSFNPLPHTVGPVSLVTQSGAFGTVIILHGEREGIGFGKHLALGNRCDVDEAELLEYLGGDAATKAVALYLESVSNAEAFEQAARGVAPRKPIVALKIGRSAAGRDISLTNTASETGDDDAYEDLFHQSGIVRVDTPTEMLTALAALLHQQPLTGKRLGLVTMTGGLAAICIEAAEEFGFSFPHLTDGAHETLKKIVPDYLRSTNPVDLGHGTYEMFDTSMRCLFNDPQIDGVMLILLVNAYITDETILKLWDACREYSRSSGKPTAWCLMGRAEVPKLVTTLRQRGLAAYLSPEQAAYAMYVLRRYGEIRARFAQA